MREPVPGGARTPVPVDEGDFGTGAFGGGTITATSNQSAPGAPGLTQYGSGPRPQNVRPAEDFSERGLEQQRRDFYAATLGLANQMQSRIDRGLPWQEGDPGSKPYVNRSRVPVTQQWLDQAREKEIARLEAEWNNGVGGVDPTDTSLIGTLLSEAQAAGVNLTGEDVSMLTNVGMLDRAANVYIQRMQAGDTQGAANVILSMQADNPVMASLVPIWAEEKIAEGVKAATDAAQNGSIVTDALTAAGDWALNSVTSPLYWANEEWELGQHALRAVMFNPQSQDPNRSTIEQIGSGLLTTASLVTGGRGRELWNQWQATSTGSFNATKLKALEGEYSPEVVAAAVKLSQGMANADPSAMMSFLEDPDTPPEVLSFVRDILWGGEPASDFDAQELMRKVDEANLGSTGQIWANNMLGGLGSGSTARETYSDAASIGAGFVDPLMFVGAPIRAVTAARYAILKLAPEVGRAGISTALASKTVAGVETNRARRFFQSFLREADRLDEFEIGTEAYASQRNRIARQFRALPDDVAEYLITSTRVKGTPRAMETVVDQQGQVVSRGLVDVLADANDAWIVASGRVADKAGKAGLDLMINRAVAAKIIDRADPMDFAAARADGFIPREIIEEGDSLTKAVIARETEQPISARIASRAQNRDMMMPRTGLLADLRRRAVNSVIAQAMPARRTREIVETFLAEADTPAKVATALNENYDVIGKADQAVLSSEALPGRAGAAFDKVTRLWSSMPNNLLIDIRRGSNADDFYKFARMFFNRKTAEMLVDAFRRGDIGVRRDLIIGVVRSGAASRGVNLTKAEVKGWFDNMNTGTRPGEMYAIGTPEMPSAIAAKASLVEAEHAAKAITKIEKMLGKVNKELDSLRSTLALDGGSDAGVAPRKLAKLESKQARLSRSLAEAQADMDRYRNAVMRFVGEMSKPTQSTLPDHFPPPGSVPVIPESTIEARMATIPEQAVVDDALPPSTTTADTVVENADQVATAAPVPDPAVIAQVDEALDRIPTFDDILNGDDELNEIIGQYEIAIREGNIPRQDSLLAAANDRTEKLQHVWAQTVLDDEDTKQLLFTWLHPEKIPDESLLAYGAEYDATMVGRQAQAAGWDVSELEHPFPEFKPGGTARNNSFDAIKWYNDGEISPRTLVDLHEQYGDEGLWRWWNTGTVDVSDAEYAMGTLGDELVRAFGPVPSWDFTPKGRRLIDTIPGEYRQAATGKSGKRSRTWLSVPWHDGYKARTRYIQNRFAEDMDRVYESVLQGADQATLTRFIGELQTQRARLTGQAAPEPATVKPAGPNASPAPAATRAPEPAPVGGNGRPPSEPPVDTPAVGGDPTPEGMGLDDLEQALEQARLRRQDPVMLADSSVAWSPSRDQFGHEHALHLYQTADWVAIPHLSQIEAIGRLRSSPLGRFSAEWLARKPTDFWSLATLYGWRFSQRSAIEDLVSYMLTGGLGHIGDLYRGRRASTAYREATPSISVREAEVAGIKTGGDEIVLKSRLGMVASRSRRASNWLTEKLHLSNRASVQEFWLGKMDPDELVIAANEARKGNYVPMRKVVTEAMIRQHYTGLSPDDIDHIADLVASPTGRRLLEGFAEDAANINRGRYASLQAAMDDLMDIPDIEMAKPGTPVVFGDYKRVGLSADNDRDPYAIWWWHRGLQAIVDDDGPIGRIAVAFLHDPAKAKAAIADAIRKDTRWGYKERFTLITDDASIDDFANRYFESVVPYFQKKNGQINENLRRRFIVTFTDKNGQEKFKVRWRTTDDRGRNRLLVTTDDLSSYGSNARPQYVLGREANIPMPRNEKALWSDRAWDWMGAQYARISREPIFLGNYLANRRVLKPWEDSQGGTPTRADRMLARQVADRQAQDAAHSFSLAYMDNPNNRSVLAWKVRNVSRYYRATEDFYRRAQRLAKNYPDAYYKLALTYQIMDDSGFTYRDENGDVYFAYPMNGFLQDVIATAFSLLPGGTAWSIGTQADPFMMGGRLKGIAPSTDPYQWLPSLAGPLGVAPMVGVMNLFPTLQGIKSLTLGEYSNAGQTGDFVGEMWKALMPAGIQRMWTAMSPEEQDAAMGSTVASTIAVMVANGDIEVDPENPMTLEQLKNRDIYGEAQRISTALLATKLVMGWTVPASPQVYQNTVTEYAREMGISSMNGFFHSLLDKYEGDYAQAFVDWAKIDPDGRFLPFTVSKTEENPDMLAALAGAKPYTEVLEWTRQPEIKALAKGFPDAYLFLAPQTGEFSWEAWAMVKALGLRVEKGENDMIIDMLAAKGERLDAQIRADYAEQMAQFDPSTDEGRKAIASLEDQMAYDRSWVEMGNPYWAVKRQEIRTPYQANRLRDVFTQTNQMLYSMREQRGDLTGTALAIENANSLWLQINGAKAGINPNTTEGKEQRRALDGELSVALASIAEADPGAANYIDTILLNLDYGSIT